MSRLRTVAASIILSWLALANPSASFGQYGQPQVVYVYYVVAPQPNYSNAAYAQQGYAYGPANTQPVYAQAPYAGRPVYPYGQTYNYAPQAKTPPAPPAPPQQAYAAQAYAAQQCYYNQPYASGYQPQGSGYNPYGGYRQSGYYLHYVTSPNHFDVYGPELNHPTYGPVFTDDCDLIPVYGPPW